MKKVKKIFKKLFLIIGYVFWAFLVCLILFRFFNNNTSLFIKYFKCNFSTSFEAFINPKSIEKLADTIGIGSILIVWLYSSLDKRELGIKYSRELDRRVDKRRERIL